MASVEDKVKALESQTEKQKTLNAELEAGLVALQQENTNRAQENKQLLEKIMEMEAMVKEEKGKDKEKEWDKMKKDLTELRSFNIIPTLGGKDGTDWNEFEFKVQSFVRPLESIEKLLDWVKQQDEAISVQNMNNYFAENKITDMTPSWVDNQLFTILSLKCQGAELQVVKNLREFEGYRGVNSWFKLTREVSQKSGARLENLTELALSPKQVKNYSDAISYIEKWENDCMELKKIENQDLTDKTKRNVLKKMLPVELQRDIERDCNLQSYDQVYKYVIQQIPLRRDRQLASKKNKPDEEIDELDQQEPDDRKEEDEKDTNDLDTIKGGGKGFNGNCNHCGKFGHKKSECWSLTQEMQGKGGKSGDKGKGKGKDGGKNAFGKGGQWSPGWQQKGKGGFQKGYGKGKGFGQGLYTNIDGDQNNWQGGYENQWDGSGSRFFLLEDSGDNSDLEDELDMPVVVKQSGEIDREIEKDDLTHGSFDLKEGKFDLKEGVFDLTKGSFVRRPNGREDFEDVQDRPVKNNGRRTPIPSLVSAYSGDVQDRPVDPPCKCPAHHDPKEFPPIGSVVRSPVNTDEPGREELFEDAPRQPWGAKPTSVIDEVQRRASAGTRKKKNKSSRKKWKKMSLGSDEGDGEMAVDTRLSTSVACKTLFTSRQGSSGKSRVETKSNQNLNQIKKWYDQDESIINPLIDEDSGGELFGSEWRQEPEGEWVKIESVMDSGASAPVAPPTMAPRVPIRASDGSRRGQNYTSASKHKLPNLGEQHLQAVTELGEETSVLFQIADVSRPLVSVSAICEMGNRVIFGRSGGVVQNLATGRETPFHRRNGIYCLSMWLRNAEPTGFTGR